MEVTKWMTLELCVLGLCGLVLSSCAMQRHQSSGYYLDEFESPANLVDVEREYNRQRRHMAAKQLGLSAASARNRGQIDQRLKLNQLERGLQTHAERMQYHEYLPMLQSDQERAEFLRQPGMAARERWAELRQLRSRLTKFSPRVLAAIDSKDIIKGMSQAAVMKSWGEPTDVQISGNPSLKNEKWTYNTDIATVDGYVREVRTLYFEGGRVVGWEKR